MSSEERAESMRQVPVSASNQDIFQDTSGTVIDTECGNHHILFAEAKSPLMKSFTAIFETIAVLSKLKPRQVNPAQVHRVPAHGRPFGKATEQPLGLATLFED